MLLIPNTIGGYGGVMAAFVNSHSHGSMGHIPDLFRHQLGGPDFIFPLAQKELAEKGVQRLLLRAQLVTPAAILLFERAQEPFQDQESALGRIWFQCRCNKKRWMFGPVGRKLGEGDGAKDKGRSRQGRQVAVERGN
jgi:hypothetical protein